MRIVDIHDVFSVSGYPKGATLFHPLCFVPYILNNEPCKASVWLEAFPISSKNEQLIASAMLDSVPLPYQTLTDWLQLPCATIKINGVEMDFRKAKLCGLRWMLKYGHYRDADDGDVLLMMGPECEVDGVPSKLFGVHAESTGAAKRHIELCKKL